MAVDCTFKYYETTIKVIQVNILYFSFTVVVKIHHKNYDISAAILRPLLRIVLNFLTQYL